MLKRWFQLGCVGCGLLFVAACETERPVLPEPELTGVNKYAGIYNGLYREKNNGVNELGVYKSDTSYVLTISVLSAGASSIHIEKGPIVVEAIEVDSAGAFVAYYENYELVGRFTNDSLYVRSKSLSGSAVPPYWFNITEITFAGRRLY